MSRSMKSHLVVATVFCAVGLLAPGALAEPIKPSPQGIEFFETKVRPVLAEHCLRCHGDKKQQGGLRLDAKTLAFKGGDNGIVIQPGEPQKSPLVKALHYDGELKMPPKGKLPTDTIETLTTWVKMGAPWPDDAATPLKGPISVVEARAKHWSFRPVVKPAMPAVKSDATALSPIDRFVLARLESAGVEPAPLADRRTLIRRVTFDLTGLPPTPEEVDVFVNDPSVDAWEKVIDRLLASPQYGERWGRHWLDVARYADTKGYVFTEERRYPFSYTYRDYVIQSFNDDKPYDRFLVEQIAADRLPLGDDKRPLAAMGFLTLGRRFLNNIHDIIDDRMDVVMRGTQGLTVACARCHDHKYDPIPQKDYYSLYGVFASSIEPKELPVLTTPQATPEYAAYEKELQALETAVKEYEEKNKAELQANNRKFREELKQLQNKVQKHRATSPGAPQQAMVLVDAPKPTQPVVFLRGNPNTRGAAVPRQFLEVVAGPERKPFTDGSGRLELAQAIASKDNPLTARVMANRVWMHHFGQGLVRTPGDFGLRGEAPTHPELLDWLAATFMENGWSIKKLHRTILLSATYQRSSGHSASDPENRLLAHQNRRRLEFEALRDSLLWASGQIDFKAGGKGVEITTAPFATRRTVYGYIERQNLPGLFRIFDLASPDISTAQRHNTTVPQQALFLMNSPFVVQQAKALANRADVTAKTTPKERIAYLYHLLYQRVPNAEEIALGQRFVTTGTTEKSLTPWEQYCQILLLANEFAFVD
jgi:hypothetical protein